jgi:hypothetical protein
VASATDAPSQFRNRAVTLIEALFAHDDARDRRYYFDLAFSEFPVNPTLHIDFSGSVAEFAADAAGKLLAFGCPRRGEHALSLLVATVESKRGRQYVPDYYEITRQLNETCALPTRAEECAYLHRLIGEIEAKARLYSPLSAIATTRPEPALPEPWADDPALESLIRHESRKQETCESAGSSPYPDILTAFDVVKRAALLGAPGAGKSTTLRKLALDIARRALADPAAPLPLLISLGSWLGDQPLSEFLGEQSPEIGWASEALSKKNRLVLLLDGLNEVPGAKRPAKALRRKWLQCQRVEPQIQLAGIVIRAALRLWMTDLKQPAEAADRLFWQLAGDERLQGVLKTWLAAGATEEAFWTVSSPNKEKQAYAKTSDERRLWSDHIPNPRSLIRLASNPFMLTMLFLVRWQRGELPRNRGELFGRFIESLVKRERLTTQEAAQLLGGLADLAWLMQTDRIATGRNEGEFGVLTVVTRETAVEALTQELLKKALDSTLLEGADELRFRHQLLQEYFTAQALRSKLAGTRAEDLWPPERWWERTGWEETAVLLAGFHNDDCSGIVRWLAKAQPEAAAQCILESGAGIANREALLLELQSAWLPRLTDIVSEPAPEARAAIGRALGRLGLDNRKGIGLRPDGVPDIDWVEIPGGEFLYQEGERRNAEAFRMARFPLTNSQFQAFVDAPDGYREERWWKRLSKPDRTPRPATWSESNHPRETVSWHDAMAFCGWLGYKLGLDVRLPTEWQWERAARGRDGRAYPWGNEYIAGCANIDENYDNSGPHYLARTSAPGIYPNGASPEGVHDLAGNVWEWCLNEYAKPDRTKSEGEQSRVLRGGSWFGGQGGARADDRGHCFPDGRNIYIGFRVVVCSPIGNAGRRTAGR